MKRALILNPAAGRGQAGARRAELEQALHDAQIEFDIITTHGRGGATELTYQAIARGYEQIVAVGGDGTINEVVNGILGNKERAGRGATLGIIPLGTGSDFVKSVEGFVETDLYGAVRRLATALPRPIDAGRVAVAAGAHGTSESTRYFINGVGMGVDAQVAVEVDKITWLSGVAAYMVASLRALAAYRVSQMTVRYDDHELRRKLYFATVANGRCQGGGFYLTPAAKIDDGKLDLCIVQSLRPDEVVRYYPKLLDGSHTSLRQVTMATARVVEVRSSRPFPVATDGEVLATDARRVTVELLPDAIELAA